MLRWRSTTVLLFVVPALASAANAAELAVAVQDRKGQPIEDAVVYARPIAPQSASVPPNQSAIIDQIDKEYVPYVTAVQAGTAISFPNRDQIRHHVYSFSDAKTFEIPLYEGTPADPVVFDTPGAVTLGCNIHDWMKAYVFVTESPFFAVTAAGGDATIELPAGGYEVEVWHPELKGEPASLTQRISVDGERASLSFSIERRHVWTPRRAPSRDGAGGYR